MPPPANQKCGTCYFALTVAGAKRECRCYAPQAMPMGNPPGPRAFAWPLVDVNDWCGEWRSTAPVAAGAEQPAPE